MNPQNPVLETGMYANSIIRAYARRGTRTLKTLILSQVCMPTPSSGLKCPWRGSNPHAFKREILSLLCLPVPPHGQTLQVDRTSNGWRHTGIRSLCLAGGYACRLPGLSGETRTREPDAPKAPALPTALHPEIRRDSFLHYMGFAKVTSHKLSRKDSNLL